MSYKNLKIISTGNIGKSKVKVNTGIYYTPLTTRSCTTTICLVPFGATMTMYIVGIPHNKDTRSRMKHIQVVSSTGEKSRSKENTICKIGKFMHPTRVTT